MHLGKAINWFFRILKDGDDALRTALPPAEEKPHFEASPLPAVQLLALLQREGRLVDFLREDISSFDDAEVGAAARDIHAGCARVLAEHVVLRRVRTEAEGGAVTVEPGFDPSTVELRGNVSGAGPHRGTLAHGGWYAEGVRLPTVATGADPKVVAPAQVELA